MKAPPAGFVHLEDVDMLNAVIVVNIAITSGTKDEAVAMGACCRSRWRCVEPEIFGSIRRAGDVVQELVSL